MLPSLDISCDSHIHTHWCGHATGVMEDYVIAAISRGLGKIIFLEHLEEGIKYFEKTWLSEDQFDLYFQEGEKLQARYKGEIDIGLGVECGYNPEALPEITRRLDKRKWDAIGISCHFLKVDDLPYHVNLFSRKTSNLELAQSIGVDRLISQYLLTLLEAVEKLPGTKVCHLDGCLRFLPGIDLSVTHQDQIEKLLKTIKRQSMSVEVNTSGFSIRKMQFPTATILTRALNLKIPLVLGSDAHQPSDVGRSFELFS